MSEQRKTKIDYFLTNDADRNRLKEMYLTYVTLAIETSIDEGLAIKYILAMEDNVEGIDPLHEERRQHLVSIFEEVRNELEGHKTVVEETTPEEKPTILVIPQGLSNRQIMHLCVIAVGVTSLVGVFGYALYKQLR